MVRASVLVLVAVACVASPAAAQEAIGPQADAPPTPASHRGVLNDTAMLPARLVADAASTGDAFSPSASLYAQALRQADVGFDLATAIRWRATTSELVGSELAARLLAGRAFGPAYVAVNAGVGQGVGLREDVDYEGGALAFVHVTRTLRLGGEARVRGELVDRFATAEDAGRPMDVLGGGTLGAELGPILVQGLGGWSLPRGPYGSGPAALANASFVF